MISATLLAATFLIFQQISIDAQQAGAQPNPSPGQRPADAPPGPSRGQGRGSGIEPLAPDDHTGFESIFDGKTLKGWDGDPQLWRGGQPRDFELKLEYRVNSTNSGVQYRSVELPEVGKWVMKGYQADIDFANPYTGQLYEERGRGFLAMRGQMTLLLPGKKQIVANLRSGDELKALIKTNDWNQVRIIARGMS